MDHISRHKRIIPVRFSSIVWAFLVIFVTAFSLVTYYSVAPSDFPEKKVVTIKNGTYISQAGELLAENNIIKSPLLFKAYVLLLSGHKQIRSGDYLFDEPQSLLRVAYRTANGVQGLPKVRITVFEGWTAKDIGNSLKKSIPNFDLETFLALAKPFEGYLFPETYFFYQSSTPKDVVEALRDTFNDKIKTALLSIQAYGKPMKDVITMASIVERESPKTDDRQIIAGILWKRIEIGMPLQVDAPFYYILGKDSAKLTLKDLAMDSPYNLYKHTGLPPTPISNPGLDAILATVMPVKTDYLFYLSDSKGNMHYAADHDGHVANKGKYIP